MKLSLIPYGIQCPCGYMMDYQPVSLEERQKDPGLVRVQCKNPECLTGGETYSLHFPVVEPE